MTWDGVNWVSQPLPETPQDHDNMQPWIGINHVIALIGIYPSRNSEPFIAEIMMFAGNFAPRGWAKCDGQLLPISQNDALFSLVGTTYGGDGRTTFGLPDLRGRTAVHPGNGPGLTPRQLGQKGGQEQRPSSSAAGAFWSPINDRLPSRELLTALNLPDGYPMRDSQSTTVGCLFLSHLSGKRVSGRSPRLPWEWRYPWQDITSGRLRRFSAAMNV